MSVQSPNSVEGRQVQVRYLASSDVTERLRRVVTLLLEAGSGADGVQADRDCVDDERR